MYAHNSGLSMCIAVVISRSNRRVSFRVSANSRHWPVVFVENHEIWWKREFELWCLEVNEVWEGRSCGVT
jgi:hypothetical protein